MTFQQAIQSGFRNYVNFEGRASRSEYWYFVLFTFLVSMALNIVDLMLFHSTTGSFHINALGALFSLAVLLPSLGLAFRRLHDTERSAWWLLINLTIIGGLVTLVFNCLPGTPGPNKYGPDPLQS